MCFKGVEVRKKLGLQLPHDLRWRMLIAFAMIEIICQRKVTKIERGVPFGPFKFQMALAQLCKNTSIYLCRHLNTSIAKGRN
jgi:hypothetical protein